MIHSEHHDRYCPCAYLRSFLLALRTRIYSIFHNFSGHQNSRRVCRKIAVSTDTESIATNVCRQIGCKWNVMFESHVDNWLEIDWMTFYLLCKDYLSNLLLKIIICCVTEQYWQTIHNMISKFCPKFKFSVSSFLRLMSCSMSIEQNCVKGNIFKPTLCPMQ